MPEMPHEIEPIRYVVKPDLHLNMLDGTGRIVPTIGNAQVYHMTGDLDRPMPTKTNTAKTVRVNPINHPFLALENGTNPAQIEAGTQFRGGLGSRPLKTEMNNQETPTYVFGDFSVDPCVVQNADHIVWCLGPRDGVSTRCMNRNIVNSCK